MRHLALTLASLMILAPIAAAKTGKRRTTRGTPASSATSGGSSSGAGATTPLWAPPTSAPLTPSTSAPAAGTAAATTGGGQRDSERHDSDAGSAAAPTVPAAETEATPAVRAAAPARTPGSKARAATLAANEASGGDAKDAPAAGGNPDLERLRADYDRLRDELFRARSRAQIVEEGLWTSRLSATFRWKGGPSYLVHHASVSLDGGEIWDSGEKPVTDDLVTVAERPVKPGPHAVTLRIDIRPGKKSKDSDKLGYVSEHTFAIIVPDGQRTRMAIKGDEDGDAPEYEPEIEVELETLK